MRFIIGLLLGTISVIFAVQNTESVDYSFLAWTVTAPRAIILLAVLVVGIVIGWLVSKLGRIFKRPAK